MPGAASFVEEYGPKLEIQYWHALFAPAATPKAAVEKLNGDTINAAVQGKLAAENIRNLSLNAFAKVEVQAERGSVTLNGVVPNADEKARAEQLAREVNGIKEITNNLKIQSVNLR